jgi:diaminohydroxyphosphoribosylaminopyrimidine deaminase/5-amino-6-(5-phosphoribosylamino)uracil reductase
MGPVLLGGDKTATTTLGVTTMSEAKHLTIQEVYPLDNDVIVIARPQEKDM